MSVDPEMNRLKFEIAVSVMPSERDQESFVSYMLGILMNRVSDEIWSYAIGQAYQCWAELHPEQEKFSRERVVCQ